MTDRFTRKDAPENRAYSIQCRSCGTKAQVAPATPSGTLPPEAVHKKFQSRGWIVGSTPRKDKCPECRKREKEMRTYNVDKNLRVDEAGLAKGGHLSVVKAEEVPTLSREDRRIILAKLNEVYQDETTGYRPGWSDQRVADDLGVDLAWITMFRQDNFGDLPVSAVDKSFLEEGRHILEQIKAVAIEADQLRNRAADLLEQAKEALEAYKSIDRKMDDLLVQEQLLAEQIAKVANVAA